ncbi:MAG: M1 family metallopeptidase [Gammaproteobacteria bacterium]|nr:M1 family metallopeptidase [Gammaproteobacteria bacterium]
MMKTSILLILFLVLPGLLNAARSPTTVHHQLEINLTPRDSTIEVTDTLTLPEETEVIEFMLHAGMNPKILTGQAVISRLRSYSGPVPVQSYRVRFATPSRTLKIRYAGKIHHPLESRSGGYGGRRQSTPGSISGDSVFLGAATYWYPVIGKRLVSFRLQATLPDGWTLVSQGKPLEEGNGWAEGNPQDDIYLIAGKYHRYLLDTKVAEAQVYLRQPDPELATRYLEATAEYLQLYNRLIGPYPYAKFALIENTWESGYGMPSFTLLGPGVIRLPFILHSSYPHEILHNWWGNGVYVDYETGNWGEGITSYLADHLIRERQGRGASYRRDTLQKYADYVVEGKDFPLVEFRGRHGGASQAVGYGKTLMFLHMLRRQLGDRQFLEGVRRFYTDNRFRTAGFDDLRKALEQASGSELTTQFNQWTLRTGAPRLRLIDVRVTKEADGYRLGGELQQIQAEPAYKLRIPLWIQVDDEKTWRQHTLEMEDKQRVLDLRLDKRPLKLLIDPNFDLFRHLDPSEIPSSLGMLFGSARTTLILPSRAGDSLRQAYESLAMSWADRESGLTVIWDNRMEKIPEDTAVWILGSENRFADVFYQAADPSKVSHTDARLSLGAKEYASDHFSYAVTTRHPDNPELAVALLSLHSVAAAPGLARKLPHYSKYSYVVFEGNRPSNVLKGQWHASRSNLTADLATGEQYPLTAPPKAPPLTRLLDSQAGL